jgi:hypothetical protein
MHRTVCGETGVSWARDYGEQAFRFTSSPPSSNVSALRFSGYRVPPFGVPLPATFKFQSAPAVGLKHELPLMRRQQDKAQRRKMPVTVRGNGGIPFEIRRAYCSTRCWQDHDDHDHGSWSVDRVTISRSIEWALINRVTRAASHGYGAQPLGFPSVPATWPATSVPMSHSRGTPRDPEMPVDTVLDGLTVN